jgi:hypothetical protein
VERASDSCRWCARPARAKGLCHRDYMRLWRARGGSRLTPALREARQVERTRDERIRREEIVVLLKAAGA